MSDVPARAFLVAASGALAHGGSLAETLETLVQSLCEQLDIESGVVFAVTGAAPGSLEIVASTDFGAQAIAALASAARNPGHPIARTVAAAAPSYDVRPTAPGGPALRSHLPLTVTRNGQDDVVGVLALAHERETDGPARAILQAAADLAAVAIVRTAWVDGHSSAYEDASG